jgi:hypothetical protein
MSTSVNGDEVLRGAEPHPKACGNTRGEYGRGTAGASPTTDAVVPTAPAGSNTLVLASFEEDPGWAPSLDGRARLVRIPLN